MFWGSIMNERRRMLFVGVLAVLAFGWVSTASAAYLDGLALYKEGNYEGAVAALLEEPVSVDAQYILGLCYYKMGKYEESKTALEGVLKQQPDHARAQINLARTLMKLNAYAAALEHAKMGVEGSPDSSGYNVLGMAAMRLKKFDEAKQAFDKAIELDPKNPWPHNNLGFMLLVQYEGNIKEIAGQALQQFNKALALAPDNALFKRNKDFIDKTMQD